jgi:hypothetical protein
MNTSIISHHLFVAALSNDGHAVSKPSPARRNLAADDLARNSEANPSPQMLAALAARPWVNWPFVGALEERATS